MLTGSGGTVHHKAELCSWWEDVFLHAGENCPHVCAVDQYGHVITAEVIMFFVGAGTRGSQFGRFTRWDFWDHQITMMRIAQTPNSHFHIYPPKKTNDNQASKQAIKPGSKSTPPVVVIAVVTVVTATTTSTTPTGWVISAGWAISAGWVSCMATPAVAIRSDRH